MKKLARIHYNENEGKVTIKIVDRRQDEKLDTTVYESNDRPLAVLEKALQMMKKQLMDFCELPDEWEDDITVLAVSAKYSGDALGITISAKRDLEGSNRPLVINSPYFHEEIDDEEDIEGAELGIFGPDCKEQFKELEKLVFDYINGDRQQLVLFKQDEPGTPAGHPTADLTLEADPVGR